MRRRILAGKLIKKNDISQFLQWSPSLVDLNQNQYFGGYVFVFTIIRYIEQAESVETGAQESIVRKEGAAISDPTSQ